MGNVLQGGQGQAPARQATILSGENKVYVLILCHSTDVVVLFFIPVFFIMSDLLELRRLYNFEQLLTSYKSLLVKCTLWKCRR